MSDRVIIWAKVWGIAATQGAITLCWVIYNLYFPTLLVQFGFSKEFAVTLLILENALEAIVEPVFGAISDRQQTKIGSNIPLISLGIVSSSVLFILLPVVAILMTPTQIWRWTLPVLAVVWAFAMAIFRAPTMSLLGKTAPTHKLPQAASILSLVGGVIGAFRFDAYGIILKLGAGFAFTIGSIALLAAAAILRWLNPPSQVLLEEEEVLQESEPNYFKFGLACLTGITVGWSLRFLIPAVNKSLTLEWGEANSKIAMTLFFIGLGLAALPVGKIATQWGNYRGILLGCGLTILAANLLNTGIFSALTVVLTLTVIIGFSFVLNGAIPFVLALVNQKQSGLGLGIYFGGLSAGISFFDVVFKNLINLFPNFHLTGATLSLLLVSIWITISLNLE
ncbi:MAG: MFS transporter [Xenococcus sp. (in: cyanobacteria)]